MNLPGWWREKHREARALWPWLHLRRPPADPPLRISTLGPKDGYYLPVPVESTLLPRVPTDRVSWLLRGRKNGVVRADTVSLLPVPGPSGRSQPLTPGHDDITHDSGTRVNTPGPEHRTENKLPGLAERLRALLALPLEMMLPGPKAVLEWPGALMPFQVEGVKELIAREKLLLADDMGLGKTLQSIAAIRVLMVRRTIDAALVVAPASLLDQWRREISRWAPELRSIIIRGPSKDRAWQWRARVHLALVSYETLLADFTDNPFSPPRRKVWDLVVLDEAQKIKNRNETSNMVKQIQRKRSWALTGTPLENELTDLASILEFVDQGETTSTRRYFPGPELLARHRELQLRRRKSDVLDQLPPKRVTRLAVSLLPRQRRSYDMAEVEGVVHLRGLGNTVRVQHVLELITRLKQICNVDPETGESAKLDDIKERLAILVDEGNRAIIFSQYTDGIFGVDAVADAVKDFQPLKFTGGMSTSERDRAIQAFKSSDRHKALILSLRAGGLGLNLPEASYVFHLDRWWNPAVERQAEDRSHRYGQVVPVNVFKYMCVGTIEERIDAILQRKQRLFDEIIDDVSLDVESHLTAEEIFGLFGLEAPVQ